MHYDFARVKHNLDRDLRGATLTMDQARELAEIIVMCTDNPKRSQPKGPIMEYFVDEVYEKISQGEVSIESRNALLPKPRGWEGD